MNGKFLSDLSSGIFSRLGELRQEQGARDQERKLETIGLLTSLADRVEPESVPPLMSHLADTIGIKGKLRGFWNSFSGLPDRSIEDQLGAKLREITAGTVGPETAKGVRAGADLARLFQPTNPDQQLNQSRRLQAENDLGGKLILRDPRAEKLDELQRTYSLKTAQQQEILSEREDLLRKRQEENDQRDFQNALKIGEQRAELKAHGDVLKRASTIALSQGVRVPTSEHLQQAAEQIAQEQGLNLDLLKSRIGLTQARIPLTEARTGLVKTREGKLAATVPDADRVKLRGMENAVKAFEGLKQNLIDSTQRGDMATASRLRKRLNSMATSLAAKYPQLEVGAGEWPYIKLRTPQGSVGLVGQPPQGGQGSQLQPSVSTSRSEAKAKLMAHGYSNAEAEQELNRLGITAVFKCARLDSRSG